MGGLSVSFHRMHTSNGVFESTCSQAAGWIHGRSRFENELRFTSSSTDLSSIDRLQNAVNVAGHRMPIVDKSVVYSACGSNENALRISEKPIFGDRRSHTPPQVGNMLLIRIRDKAGRLRDMYLGRQSCAAG